VLVALSLLCLTASTLLADKASDDKICDEVKMKLAMDSVVKGGGFTVTVTDGVVTISGKIRAEKQKERAEKVTRKVKGVVKIVNRLVIEL
jgi:osmotically-inducible protein OsmY